MTTPPSYGSPVGEPQGYPGQPAPGYPPESSDDANRLYESRTPAYLWLVANAGRFGFVSYPFEPWHWEWTGEPV